jgi:hypothetical protein
MSNLERVHHYFRDFESPAHFITWPFLFMVASCLGRKVHLQELNVGIFPNIYPIIVGPPGVGKSFPTNIMTKVLASLTEIARDGKTPQATVCITPSCVTLEALYDFIEAATRAVEAPPKSGKFYHHASVSFALGDEMGLLFKNKDATNDLISFLIAGFDCGSFDYKTKKSGSATIKNMCINFLGCCTPTWMARSMSSDMIGEGFASRCIFIWGEEERQITTRIHISPDQVAAMEDLKKHFANLAKLQGQVTETDEAFKFFDDWYHDFKRNKIRINHDKKLDYYYKRKKLLMQKIAMLVHFSERYDLVLTVDDYKNALMLLNGAELDMHKALSMSTRNPLAAIAEQIKKVIYSHKLASSNRILAECFDGGNHDEIEAAKKYLVDTQQIELTTGGYVIKEELPTAEEQVSTSGDLTNPGLAYLPPEVMPNFLPASSTDNQSKL